MQDIPKKLHYSEVIIIFIIAALTFMFFPAWIPFLRRGWILLILATVIIVLNWHKYLLPQAILALVLYGCIIILHIISGDVFFGSTSSAIYECLILFVPSSIALYCTKSGNLKFLRALAYLTMIALAFEFVASLIVLQTNPGMIRSLAGISAIEGDSQLAYEFYKLGLMDYSMGHAIPILIPTLFCLFKENKGWRKWSSLILIIGSVVLVWFSESSTALLLTMIVLVMGLVVNKKASIRMNLFLLLIVFFFSLFLISDDGFALNFFSTINSLIGEESFLVEKLEELQLSFIDNQTTGDLGSRMDLYRQSIDMFFSNILWGSSSMPGHHSGILDRFATLGFAGVLPLSYFFYISIKTIFKSIPRDRWIYYLECILAAFLMLLFKAMWLWPVFLFLFVISPCVLLIKQNGESGV